MILVVLTIILQVLKRIREIIIRRHNGMRWQAAVQELEEVTTSLSNMNEEKVRNRNGNNQTQRDT